MTDPFKRKQGPVHLDLLPAAQLGLKGRHVVLKKKGIRQTAADTEKGSCKGLLVWTSVSRKDYPRNC